MFSRIVHIVKLWFVVTMVALCLLFAAVNRDMIDISLFPLPYIVEIPKFLLAIVSFAAGLLVGGVIMSLKLGRAYRLAKQEHRQVMALQNEVAGMKAEKTALVHSL